VERLAAAAEGHDPLADLKRRARESGRPEDWFELARQVRVRKFGENLPAEFAEKARQMRFLQYRGFDAEQIQVAVSSHGDDLS